ncbi:hypothetical protein CHS0354_020353 [Potamilus streckersoni]|uniref:CUB domain-containing protein n=1 Tax=Potamilus streckersoni TaxID=2493646 RepID=A0AAE0SFJ2_9BIVA|nr:hypothetical protein CHS0354_020353 [Potamilus streckersoni]
MDFKREIFIFVTFIILCLDSIFSLPEYFMEDHCTQTLTMNYGSIEAVRIHLTKSKRYGENMGCSMRVEAPEGKLLIIRFEDFDVRGIPDLMCQSGDFVEIFDGSSEIAAPILPGLPRRLCSSPEQKIFLSSGRHLIIRFISDTDMIAGKGFRLLITAFSIAPCSDAQLQCSGSGLCLQKKLECDGEINCPDESDEALPKCLSTAAIAGIAVGCGIVLILIIVAIVIGIICYQRKKRARIIKLDYDGETMKASRTRPYTSPSLARHNGINTTSA